MNTGSAGVSLLLDPTAHQDGPGIRVDTRDTEPRAEPAWAAAELHARLGAPSDDRAGQFRYAVDALAHLVDTHRPDVAVLWLTEPDASQHRYGPGSAQSLAALAAADTALGWLVDALEALGHADDTNLWIASDHGSSPMTGRINLAAELAAAGFDRGIYCCDDGTSAIWLDDPADPVAERLVGWLRRQPWTGVLFGAGGLPDTVPLSLIGAAGPRSPQLIVGYAPGWYAAQAGPTTDAPDFHGCHGSGYRRDVHAVLQVTGPDYRSDVDLPAPAGLVDVLPTIAATLGIEADFDGRVLTEARPGGPAPAATTARLSLPGARATVSRVAGVSYVDEIVPAR
ncbi:alkaline phosphatase family protein [Actinocatenispora thailandica]|uniref:alkaline phosphatase family protein n=1 Tax=Actinocatenispora thailandica TaxID=227318 RepID=UPI00195215AB|nr:alkaline phosphatase family protein [Actinocatenispora thailandica]